MQLQILHVTAVCLGLLPLLHYQLMQVRNRQLTRRAIIATGIVTFIYTYRVAQKTGPPYLIANILKISRQNCVEIGELLQYYMLNTVINFSFKNFIALWRHVAKTQLLCDAQIYFVQCE